MAKLKIKSALDSDSEVIGSYSKYKTGTFIMGRCTVVVTKNSNDNWQLVTACTDNIPSQKEIAQARYKYLPDDITMARIYPSKNEFKSVPENMCILIQLIK